MFSLPFLTCWRPRRRVVTAAAALFLVSFGLLAVLTRDADGDYTRYRPVSPEKDASPSTRPETPPLSIPELDSIATPGFPPSDQFCTDRFTARYLHGLRNHTFDYCDPQTSRSRLLCFHAHAREDAGVDSFCLGTGAALLPGDDGDADNADNADNAKPFVLDCTLRLPTPEDTKGGIPAYGALRPYWGRTGAYFLLKDLVRYKTLPGQDENENVPAATGPGDADGRHRFLLLVRREGNHNLWHKMMELWAMTMTFDVLRLTRDPNSGEVTPFFRFPEDLENTQVVVVDDFSDEPFFDLWGLFSHHPIVRLADLVRDAASSSPAARARAAALAAPDHTLILPLAGASCPLWQNDWTVRGRCRDAPLLSLFVQRVLAHAGVAGAPAAAASRRPKSTAETVAVTVIDRRGSRQLLGAKALLAAVESKYSGPDGPTVRVRSVDMAALSFAEQLRLVQATDVLVGVHGAGLTHALFMREGAGAVVEIQPAALGHTGFRNLAAMRGQSYFMAEATVVGKDGKVHTPDKADHKDAKQRGAKPWQSSNVRIEEERFLALMDAAITSLYKEVPESHDGK